MKPEDFFGTTTLAEKPTVLARPPLSPEEFFGADKKAEVFTQPIQRPFGILGEEVQKGTERFKKAWESADVPGDLPAEMVSKTALAFTAPLRVAGAAARGVARTVSETLSPLAQKVFEALPEDRRERLATAFSRDKMRPEIRELLDKTDPEVKQTLSDIFEVFSTVGGGTAAKATGKAAVETTTQAARATAKGAAKVAVTTGRAVSEAGGSLYRSAITPTAQEAERILADRAKRPFLTRVSEGLRGEGKRPLTRGQTALEQGLYGTETMLGFQARRANQKLWERSIAPAVKASDKVITKEDLFEPIRKRITETAEPGRKRDLEDAFEAIQEDYIDIDVLSLDEAQSIKRGLDEFTPDKIFKGKSVKNEYQTLKNDMANAIRNKTYEALGDVNIKKQYLDWANLKELEKVGVKALTEAGRQGGSGKLLTYLWDKATVPIKTVGGQVLYRVGNAVEFIGEKGVKTFGEFLEKQGYSLPQ